MADGISTAAGNAALTTLAATYPWVKLHIGAPGSAGTSNAATETTRKQVTWAAASSGSVANSGALTWLSVAAAETYTHFTAWTLSAGGSFGFSGSVTANAVGSGDTFNVAIGALTASLTVAS